MHLAPAPLTLEDLGWTSHFEGELARLTSAAPNLLPARVTEESKNLYRVRSAHGEYLADIAGKLRHSASSRTDIPAVGDWVAITARAGENRARIDAILPRKTKLSRKVAGRTLEEQIVATNIDTVFVVASLNLELNPRRVERYLAVVWESGAQPVVLLNKSDLCDDAAARLYEVEQIALGVDVHLISATEQIGLDVVHKYLRRGRTAAFVGSSGVGKSTLINALTGSFAGPAALSTQSVRESDDRGRHTTTSRQMIFLPPRTGTESAGDATAGILIDTPGMREIALWDASSGTIAVFDDILQLAENCKFRDCTHRGEPGCAVTVAAESGALDPERLENYFKLQAEMAFQERKVDPEKARETKEKWKQIHKAMRNASPKK